MDKGKRLKRVIKEQPIYKWADSPDYIENIHMKNEVKKLILVGIILIVLAFVFIGLPLWAKLIVLVINSFIPDPIPIVDEVLMIAATLNDIIKIYKAMRIAEWIRSHKLLSFCICIVIIVLLSSAISMLFG